MRIVQRFNHFHDKDFMALEAEFAKLEKRHPHLPQGRRLRPISGMLPTHTLIWEGEFDSLEAARAALRAFENDPEHAALFARQGPLIEEIRVEFYEKMELTECP